MYVHRVKDFAREDDVEILLTNGTTLEVEYIMSTDAFVFAANENGQFSLPVANILWIRKDLKSEDY